MPEGLFIKKTGFNVLVKDVAHLADYIKNSLKERNKSTWITQEEIMEVLGCRHSKLEKIVAYGKDRLEDNRQRTGSDVRNKPYLS